jgi:hypothetical protein
MSPASRMLVGFPNVPPLNFRTAAPPGYAPSSRTPSVDGSRTPSAMLGKRLAQEGDWVSRARNQLRRLAQEHLDCLFAGSVSSRHRFKIDLGAIYRGPVAGTVNFPAPWFVMGAPVLDDHGVVGWVDLRGHTKQHAPTSIQRLAASSLSAALFAPQNVRGWRRLRPHSDRQ